MKVFISGSISIKTLPQIAKDKLNKIMTQNLSIIIGDANGVDALVQRYLSDVGYKNVLIYHVGNSVRNNIGNWQTVSVPAQNLTGRALLLAPGENDHFEPIENNQFQPNKKSHCHNS